MLYGIPLKIPGEFFTNEDMPPDPQIFIEKFREHIRQLRPIPTAHHIKKNIFVHPDIYQSSHVFLRCDMVKKPLEPPYTGPHEVVERINDHLFTIKVNGQLSTVHIDRLKPAFIDSEPANGSSDSTKDATSSSNKTLRTYTRKKTVTFSH